MDQETMDNEAWGEYITSLEDLHNSPLDINTATPEEMAQIPFLTPEQIEALQAYIHLDGPMKTLGELALIPELDTETGRILSFFFTIQSSKVKKSEPRKSGDREGGETLKQKFWNWLTESRPPTATIDSRLDVPLNQRKGQTDGKYAGDGLYNRLRVNLATTRIQTGFHAEKDAGERWYDSYGGYVIYQGRGIIRQIAGGDYRAGWGEGLVMSSRSLMLKSTNGLTQSQGIRPMKSTTEYSFLRGAALTMGTNGTRCNVQGSAFISYRHLDATLTDEGYAKTIVTGGYHRTDTEIAKKGNTPTLLMGGHAQLSWNHLVVGLTGFFQHYERPLDPGTQDYRRYWPTGLDMGTVGIHASYNHYRINTGGEIAYSLHSTGGLSGSDGSGGSMSVLDAAAATGRFGYTFSRSFRAILSGRYFGKGYYSSQAATLSEGSDVRNQAGGMLSVHAIPLRPLTIDAYIDVFCDLWPRYGMTHTSYGQDFMLQNTLTTRKAGIWALSYHLKRKETSDEMGKNHKIQFSNTIQPVQRTHFQLRLKTTANLHLVQTPENSESTETTSTGNLDIGYALTENIHSKFLTRKNHNIHINLDASWFDTPDYQSRVYLTQTNLWSSFSYLMCYGQGVSTSFYIRYTTPGDRLMIEARHTLVHRFDTDTQGSSYQQINSPTRQDISLQLRVRL